MFKFITIAAMLCVCQGQSNFGNPSMLDAHNRRRCLHGSPNLSWNQAAADSMRNTMARTGCAFAHQGDSSYGENLWSGSWSPSAEQVLTLWYDNEKGWSGLNHYTQVVWKSTTSVGCAICQQSGGSYVVGCRYNPAGNVIGQEGTNVPPQIRTSCTATGGSTGGTTTGGSSSCQRVWGYTPIANLDRYGGDIAYYGALAPSTLAGQCNSLSNCRSFNSGGWVKNSYTPLTSYQGTCLYVKGCPGITGYTVYAYTDAPGYDIANSGTADVLSTANQCNSRSNCVAFNSDGWMKYSSSPRTSNGGYCLYVKNAARREAITTDSGSEISVLESVYVEEPHHGLLSESISLYASLAAFVACGLAASSFLVYKRLSAARPMPCEALKDITTTGQEMEVQVAATVEQDDSPAAQTDEAPLVPMLAEHDTVALTDGSESA